MKPEAGACVYLIGNLNPFLDIMCSIVFDGYTPKRGEMKRARRTGNVRTCGRPGKYQRQQDGAWFCGMHKRAAIRSERERIVDRRWRRPSLISAE